MSNRTHAGPVVARPPTVNRDASTLASLRDVLRDLKQFADSSMLPDEINWDEEDADDTSPEYPSIEQQDEGDMNVNILDESMTTNGDVVDDEDEITPLKYARFHGLSRNYLADTLAFDHLQNLQAFFLDISDDDSLTVFDFGTPPRLDEHLVLSKDSTSLFQKLTEGDTQEKIDALILPMLGSTHVKSARVELPILGTDHVRDCKAFARREDFEIKLEDVNFPLEQVDEEKDEVIRFRSSDWEIGDCIMKDLEKEKLVVSKSGLAYLQTALKDDWTDEGDEVLWQVEVNYKRNRALDPMTPPLFPVSAPPGLYEPSSSSPAFQLDVLSEPESLTRGDLVRMEKDFFRQDIPTPIKNARGATQTSENVTLPSSDESDIINELDEVKKFLDSEVTTSPDTERLRRDDFKVEGPLTPTIPVVSDVKMVRFSDVIEEMDFHIPSPTSSTLVMDNTVPAEKVFLDNFGDAARNVNEALEQETLLEADAKARVEVRQMESVVTEPPWKEFQECKSPRELLSLQMKLMESIVEPCRRLTYPFSQEKLRYNPFPHNLAKIALEEHREVPDEIWKKFLVDPADEDIVDSSNLTWKPDGLLILKVDDDGDDEIEPGKFAQEEPRDMSFLVRKRKLELQQDRLIETSGDLQWSPDTRANITRFGVSTKGAKISQKASGVGQNAKQVSHPPSRNFAKTNNFVIGAQKLHLDEADETRLLLGGQFSAEEMLGNFMELRGAKKPKLVNSSHFPPKADQGQRSNPLSLSKNQTSAVAHVDELPLPIRLSPLAKPILLPAPAITWTQAQKVIASSTLFKHRTLIKALETLLPNLILIERNFSAHNTTTWMPNSVARSPITSPLDSEADLIISPSAGVVLTTLQKIKQKPLPGQKSKPELRARLERVSIRYDKLVVLVTETRAEESTYGLDETDCLALSEFQGFAASLVATTSVHFVGEGTLGNWLASVIAQHRMVAQEDLLEEETHWELFLRRAGMNAYAAQIVVTKLKAPEGVDATSRSKAGFYGLTAFLEMGREQRIEIFEGICGRGVVERVSAVVDARWT